MPRPQTYIILFLLFNVSCSSFLLLSPAHEVLQTLPCLPHPSPPPSIARSLPLPPWHSFTSYFLCSSTSHPGQHPSTLNSCPSHFSFSFTTSLTNKASYALTESHVSRNDSLPPPLTDSFSHLFLPCFTLPNRTHLLLHRISPTHFELKLSGFPKLLPFQDFSSPSAGHVIYAIHSKQTNTSLVSSKLVF